MIYKETLSSRHKKCKKLKRSAMPFRAKAHVDMHALVWSVMMALVGGVRTLASRPSRRSGASPAKDLVAGTA